MPEISTAEAILKAKCPRCHIGDIYKHPALHTGFSQTHKTCPHCGLMYEQEPGFFFGAMYISYAFAVAILLGTSFVLYFGFNDPPTWVYMLAVPLVTLLFVPFSFRYSRVLYLYAFGGIRYDRSFARDRSNP
ncbi:DUF983 domain-containing protein [Cesiribacter andamanensis]|uniref:DUF983 domain-containing protein n=1 Tax=Cesiribacter andamanensis AMV16 TaxID=1279009 RepID=M7NX52_9BACT|nr:DUF983 domain-containing protein [Cesiribacter andamanensis]EMR03024.1 hypothetical protein ADICEAN_01818 [Cesiribacter andamanensis AMV16]